MLACVMPSFCHCGTVIIALSHRHQTELRFRTQNNMACRGGRRQLDFAPRSYRQAPFVIYAIERSIS